jgi:hypothetical protein
VIRPPVQLRSGERWACSARIARFARAGIVPAHPFPLCRWSSKPERFGPVSFAPPAARSSGSYRPSATVGGNREARMAGIRPAAAPVTARPRIRTDRRGIGCGRARLPTPGRHAACPRTGRGPGSHTERRRARSPAGRALPSPRCWKPRRDRATANAARHDRLILRHADATPAHPVQPLIGVRGWLRCERGRSSLRRRCARARLGRQR